MSTENDDQPLSPAGRLFVQPATHQIINCVLGLERAIDINQVRAVLDESLMIKHPRFSSLLIANKQGLEHWRKINIDLDRHIILHPDPISYGDNDEEIINDYVADLTVSSPLSIDKPLWEVHILQAHKCVVLRIHHALGDGISLVSLMLTMCRKRDDLERTPTIEPLVSSKKREGGKLGILKRVLRLLKVIWFTVIYVMEFVMRGLWLSDGKTVVSGGDGVEMWPRKLVTAKFSVDDMKMVKSVVANATINDVLFGIISSGLSKYLDHRSPDHLQDGLKITGVALVNLRPSPGLQDIKELMKKNAGAGWGNKVGIMLLPVYYHRNVSDPLEYLKRAKMMIDSKKLSAEAYLSHQIGQFVMKFFGAKVASTLNYKVICNTSFTISNVVGPREEITVAGIPVTYIRTTSSSLPHAITMHMVSYAGKADMQILVAKYLIPDPEKLARCFEDALHEMKEYALRT